MPTIFTEGHPSMRIAQEEIFGPVVLIMPVNSFEEAIEVINSTNYGLSSSVYTKILTGHSRQYQIFRLGLHISTALQSELRHICLLAV